MRTRPTGPSRLQRCASIGALLALLALPGSAAHAAPAPTDGAGSGERMRRVLPKRCVSSGDEGRPCADLAESVDRWFDEVDGGGVAGSGAGASIGLIVSTEALVTSTALGQDLGIHVGGTGPLLSWHLGAGALHSYQRGAFGFTLSGAGGLRLERYSPWSILVGIKFMNLTQFWDDEPAKPAQHILGELGGSYDLAVSKGLMIRFGVSALLGAQRRFVARFDGAREVVDEVGEFSAGGAIRIALWVR